MVLIYIFFYKATVVCFQDSIYELADENTATHNEVQKVIGKAAAARAEEKPKDKVGQFLHDL